MVSRLVLGCGTVGHAVLDALADGGDDLRVLDPDEDRVETLRNEKIPAEQADVTDPVAVAGTRQPDVVFVAGDDSAQNATAVRAATEAYPDAYLVAFAGEAATREQRESVAALADRSVSAGEAILASVDDVVGSGAMERARQLRRVVESVDGTLGVFTHDNPDPDAIASAVALVRIAESVGVDAEACYFGDISHQENRALVNLLEFDLRQLEPDEERDHAGVALVDHSRPGVNDQLPEGTDVDVVIDHHPPKVPVEARFVDLREDAGATSTLLADYLPWFDVDVTEGVATGLLYGIRVDTRDFTREISEADFEAAARLLPDADTGVLSRVESPSMSADTLDTIARAIRNRETRGSVLSSCVGALADRDALAQSADRLLTLEGVSVTLVYGFKEGTVYLSARARGDDVDLGSALRDAFDGMGSAGGHADMAGAQIPLGLFGEMEQEAEIELTEMVQNVVSNRFFETMRAPPETVEE
jgi:nanoRNase/pAp phosphatase (c-di-AMP/oligoRNAs hydrolase)